MDARLFPALNIILSIDDGPKKGETLDRRPGSLIRIGRVVRGNTIAIKDPGISQKHLTIAFRPEISQWAVTDHSSNGTIINNEFISPNANFSLADGDHIKIGESTLISVKMSVPSSSPEPQTRRGRRMAAAAAAAAASPVDGTQGNGSTGSAIFLSNAEALNRMAEECKSRKSTRASSMACSARVSKELQPVVVKGGSRSANKVLERTDRVSMTKDEEREVRQEKADKRTKNRRKGKDHFKIEVKSTGVLRKDEVLESVAVKRKMVRVEDLNQIVEEGKEGRPTRASAMACSARHTKEDEMVEENTEEPTENPQQRRKTRYNRGIVSARALRDDKALKPVVVEGDCRSWASESSAKVLEENVGVEIGQQNVGGPTKNEMKRRISKKSGVEPAKFLRKDAALGNMAMERKLGKAAKALSMDNSSRVMIIEEQDGELLEKIEGLVKDGREGMRRAKRGGRNSMKDEVLERLVVEGRIGRVTRASTRVMDSSARVAEEHEEEDKENKEDKAERPAKTGRKQKARGKRGGRSTRISRKDETLEPAPMEGKMEGMTRAMDVAVVSSFKDSKELQKNHVMSKLDLHSDELAYSRISFSELRGIPNTTSKYREDKLINWHATPFEERVQRALKRGFTETFADEF